MSKPGLGRGLSHLLDGAKTPGKVAALASLPTEAGGSAPGRGLGTLLKGLNVRSEAEASAAKTKASDIVGPPAFKVPQWFFLVADLLLIVLAAQIVFNNATPLRWPQILFCVLAVGLGGFLCSLPFLLERQTKAKVAESIELPKWVLGQSPATDGANRRFVIHLHQPNFVGEVIVSNIGKPSVSPLWVDRTAEVSVPMVEQLMAEAVEFCVASAGQVTASPERAP